MCQTSQPNLCFQSSLNSFGGRVGTEACRTIKVFISVEQSVWWRGALRIKTSSLHTNVRLFDGQTP